MKKALLVTSLLIASFGPVIAQSKYFTDSKEWLQKAEACKPELSYHTITPERIVRSVQDTAAFQGWRMEDAGKPDMLFDVPFKKHPSVTVDFGDHYTGYLTFSIKPAMLKAADAPIRLKFTLAEVPGELNASLEPYKGTLARSWVQDEIVTITSVPAEITIPRRLSGRYLKIELLGISRQFDFVFDKLEFTAQTSVTTEAPALTPGTDSLIQDIYKVGLNTLKECMQTVYEDGPKRDRRLWIGDLYLEALANAYSFKNHRLTKHCLYLLAALANDEGLLHATILEEPKPHPQYGTHTLDYCLIYNVALLEYLKETGDMETADDLWPVAVRQIEMALRQFSPEWIYDMGKHPQYWLVFDWKDGYDRQASMQGLTIFALDKSYELAKMLGKEKQVGEWPAIAQKMKKAARQRFYDKERGVIVSGRNNQVSYLSQVWMILSNTLNAKEGAKAMRTVMSMPDACYPGCPYAYHYVMEALLACGMQDDARTLMTDYWGSMVERGADTFWEVYDPDNDYLSPYGSFAINSYCHAWSCTPVYFINKYPEIFQK